MIEGGPGMFEACGADVDAALCFVSPQSGGTIPFAKTHAAFEIMHSQKVGSDLMLWLKGKK
jgi:hypothetical protein